MIDHLGNTIHFKMPPKRILSLVPSQTELIADLGMQDYIVGVTKFCVYPTSIRKKAKVVGGTKNVHFDKIKLLKPDIILCNKEENTKEMVGELQNIAPVHVAEVVSLEDAYQLMLDYGQLFHQIEKANELIEETKANFQKLKSISAQHQKHRVAYFIWKKPWMVAANQTYINSMINELGLINVFEHLNRYPEVNLDNLPEVDWIFLSSEPFPFKKDDFSAFSNKRLKLEVVDGECFSWFGSRMKKSFSYFENLLLKMNNYS
jgi:ABC-type Fe3+-hydroxamate transport system substrate-binding protein